MTRDKAKQILTNRRVLAGLWLIVGLASALAKLRIDRHNNFDIFRYVFYHTWQETSLYAEATDGGYWDINHYGPFFSLIIAPFAVIPVQLGLIIWCTSLAVFLFWAVSRFCSAGGSNPLSTARQSKTLPFIIWFCAHELLTALFMQQFNVAIAGIILLSYYFMEKERDEYATLFIVIGALVKLYGIVGLAFFFFSRHKVRYVLSFAAWSILLFALPMLISSPEYQISQYQEWFTCLVEKNGENGDSIAQNISVLGMAHRISGLQFSDLWILLPALGIFGLPYLRFKQYASESFRQMILASVLMFVCLFSTGTESSGYIIALTGVAIWYCCVPWQRSNWDVALIIFAFILTSLSPSDLFPRYIRQEFVQPYALKALPVFFVWLKLSYELMTKDYKKSTF